MQALLLNHDRTLSTDYLLEHVWNNDTEVKPETVWLYISYLKRKLKAIASSVTITGTEREGYILS